MAKKSLNIEQVLVRTSFLLKKNHLNQNKKLQENLGTLFQFLDTKPNQWVGSNCVIWEICRHGLQERLKFEFFGSLEIQLNYQKWFWKWKLVG
jgi:hypothetical protein